MTAIECDVLVVGAGPAGSSTARATAKMGLKTILIEEDNQIGKPVQCAEGIGSYLLPFLPFKIPGNLLKWEIKGMYFWADDMAIKKEGDIWSGYSINRMEWDNWLASMAQKEGAEILTNTKLLSLDMDNDYLVRNALAETNNKKINFKPNFVVAADGVNSTIIDCLGIRKKESIGYVKSYEMGNINLQYPRYDQLFFGEFAPRAYAYIFPLSKTNANLGVGTLNQKDELDDLYEKFIDLPLVKKQISNGNIISEKSGEAPIENLTEKLVYGNIFLVGDSANQNIKPFIEGNIPGIICGDILGNFIFDIRNQKGKNDNYEKIINERFSLIKESQDYAKFVYGENTIENKIFNLILLGLMSNIITPNELEIEKFVSYGYDFIRDQILKNGGLIEK
jgi:digeranylgeranylglycerophospholipid reductase